MSGELAECFEVLVETFARKIAALAIDAGEQKGRADKAEAEVERLRREYEPGYPPQSPQVIDLGAALQNSMDQADERNRLRAEIAQLKVQAEAIPFTRRRLKVERDEARAELAGTTAKLGRAIGLLQEIGALNRSAVDDNEGLWDPRSDVHARLDAILADADGTQAAAAWRELEAAYASHNQRGEDGPCECDYCKAFAALAAVDARRGGSK